MKKLWQKLIKPSSKLSILALVLVGIGITLAGTFVVHKGFEVTSTIEFCTFVPHHGAKLRRVQKKLFTSKMLQVFKQFVLIATSQKISLVKYSVNWKQLKIYTTTSLQAKLIRLKNSKIIVLKWHKPFGAV